MFAVLMENIALQVLSLSENTVKGKYKKIKSAFDEIDEARYWLDIVL